MKEVWKELLENISPLFLKRMIVLGTSLFLTAFFGLYVLSSK